MKIWVPKAKELWADVPLKRMAEVDFNRNPTRLEVTDSRFFFSPADGVIMNQGRMMPNERVEAKGVYFTLAELMHPWPMTKPCLVISIFMNFYDVHWNRAPTAGLISHEYAPPLRTANLPMLYVEHGILDKKRLNQGDRAYVKANARMLNEVYSGALGYKYWMVQLADSDVEAIMPIRQDPIAPHGQCETFSFVCSGSEVALVLPLDSRYKFKTLCKVTDHVEAGVDPLVEVKRRG